ncbi:hypothetical protein F444_15781 [Phytophthora nicotianae P1976]|uniref:Uncharacterized protein n=1 Tax=Phytophthora nicotianae P1976 TaxID=1317066 RepID=A0A080ZKU0_PHYNI|nr:hypothetical protein F444_15781 [Phytophthora nicotianae P1976]
MRDFFNEEIRSAEKKKKEPSTYAAFVEKLRVTTQQDVQIEPWVMSTMTCNQESTSWGIVQSSYLNNEMRLYSQQKKFRPSGSTAT